MEHLLYYKDYMYGYARSKIQPLIYNKFAADKITENIYLSNYGSSLNKIKLKEEGITHILTLVVGVSEIYPEDFKYKIIELMDHKKENISQYFNECINFIDECSNNNGKILIHCSQGISRSPTIVIAYLIKKYSKNYTDIYNYIKEKREIIEPNDGFKKQLLKFNIDNL
jgi:protein-tyrosine phosphatase